MPGRATDALDVALKAPPPPHVAANPKLTKPQADFFGTVAGRRSAINPQSSRIKNPFATNTDLAGGGATVVPPALQLQLAATTLGQTPAQRLAKTIADDAKPAPGRKPLPTTPATRAIVARAPAVGSRAARALAKKTEAAYAGPADRVVRTTTRTGPGIGSPLTVSATAPDILAAATRLRNLGIPIGALSPSLQSKIGKAFKSALFSPTYQYGSVPDLNRYTPAMKAALGLPASATDGDYLRAKYAKWLPHENWLSGALDNVPRNSLELVQAGPAIANALGVVAHQGILGNLNTNPKDAFGVGQGDWKPAEELGKEFVREQVQYGKDLWNHPGATIQKDPVTFATSALGVGRVFGAGAGMAARAGLVGDAARDYLTPAARGVVPAGYDAGDVAGKVPEIPRGETSGKLDERVAQTASDYLAQKVPFFGQRLEKTRALATKREESRLRDAAYRKDVEPAVRAVAKLGRPQRRAVTFARGQGVTEGELADYYEGAASKHAAVEPIKEAEGADDAMFANEHAHWQLVQRDLENQAKDWRGIADKTGDSKLTPEQRAAGADVATPEMKDALAKSTRASRAAEAYIRQGKRLNGRPLIEDATMTRRAYMPQMVVRAAAGDENAAEYVELDKEAQALERKLQSADPAHHEAIVKQIETIKNEQFETREKLLGEVNKRIGEQQRVVGKMQPHAERTPAFDAVERILNRQGLTSRPEAARLAAMQGKAEEAFPVGDRIRPSELETANTHLRRLETKLRAAQGPATRRRLQAKIDEFTQIRDKMAAAPVGPEARQLRAQAARAGVESRTAAAAEQVAAPRLPKALAADEAQSARMMRPAQDQLDKLVRQRDRLEAKRTLPSDYTNAHVRELERRAVAADPERHAAELAQVERELAQRLAVARNAHRGVDAGRTAEPPPVGPASPFIGPQKGEIRDPGITPLDQEDPLYFPHTRNNRGRLQKRIVGGQGGGKVNLDVTPQYAGRLGKKGNPFNAGLLAQGGVDSDPALFFGAAAKPAAITSALQHLRAQMSGFSVKAEPGMQYDARRWVVLDLNKTRNEADVSANARTSEHIERQIGEHTGSSDKRAIDQLFSHFHDELPGVEGKVAQHQASVVYKQVPTDPKGEYVLVSRHAYESLQNDFLHGGIYSSLPFAKLQKTTQMWRWATLMARPAWLVSNFAGNTIQAATGGAGIASFARAAMSKYDDVTPERLKNVGLFRNDVARPASSVIGAHSLGLFGDRVANANVAFENYTRKALYLRHALPEARRAADAENKRLGAGFKRTNEQVMAHLKELGVKEDAAPKIVKVVNRWLGDFSRAKNTPLLDLVSPFHRWFTFIAKLVATMPVRTPGRALLLQRIGALGINEQNQQFGGFVPNSMAGAIEMPGGLFKSTQALNPYATVFQLLDPADESSTRPGGIGYGGLASALNPAITAATEFSTGKSIHNDLGDLKDAEGRPTGPFNLGVLAHEVENAVPLMSALQGYNSADTSWNPFNPQAALRSTSAQEPIPAWMRAVGYFGGSVRRYNAKQNADQSLLRLNSAELKDVMSTAKSRQQHG